MAEWEDEETEFVEVHLEPGISYNNLGEKFIDEYSDWLYNLPIESDGVFESVNPVTSKDCINIPMMKKEDFNLKNSSTITMENPRYKIIDTRKFEVPLSMLADFFKGIEGEIHSQGKIRVCKECGESIVGVSD